MEQQVPWERLVQYFAGELTREENRKMESWISANPHREQQVGRLYEIWQESGDLPYQLDEDEAWNNLTYKIDELEKESPNRDQRDSTGAKNITVLRDKKKDKPRNTAWRFMMAAAAAILLVVGLFAYYGSQEEGDDTNIGIRELVAKEGERATYILNDSTRIMLHAGSRLEVPINFNINRREIFLKGEAYFEVTPDPSKPFIVHSGDAYTRVLGTKFLVQAWPENDGHMEVVVSEGKVAFGNNSSNDTGKAEEAVVSRNQKGVLSRSEGPVVTDNADLEWYLGWTEDQLFFDNRPLHEIIPRLERWYDVDIKTADQEIASKKLTAEIDVSQSMGEVMRNIALSLDIEVEKKGSVVRFNRMDNR